MHKQLIGVAAIVAVCLAGHTLHRAKGDENKTEAAADKPAESLDVQSAEAFRKLVHAPYNSLLMLGYLPEAAQQRLRVIERMVHYSEAAYDMAAPQQPSEAETAALAKGFRQDADAAEDAYRMAKRRRAGSVSRMELQEMFLEIELLRLRAEQASKLTGKSQLERIEWKVDVLSQELWFLIDRVSKADVRK